MSRTIDEKVVEMRFDNKHFENNVRDTMSTLDKLKQKLNLTGASKGLENINTQANKVNMSGMANAIENVRSKFSALEVMGVTALANITNSAINAGKRMVKSLTIDPVMDGFKEYEMVLNAVQTTMAGTGKTAEEVEKELQKLDEYADKTVYSTSDMLNNLPKFTNAGVELEKATTAMIGIANATALAGGDAGKASIAFYNLGQAIGTGYLTRMDYNSINNAGIATMEWKEQMVEAALAAGTLTKAEDGLYKAGKKTFTIQQLFIDGLQEQWATTDVMMKVFGDYGDTTTEIGKKAQASAQDIKTFTQMMESLKATAGTGWKETWQLIFGGLDEAKEFWTGLSEFISKIITSMADFRNNLLGGALGKSFKGISKSISSITEPLKKVTEATKKVTDSVKDMGAIVNKVIRGDFGNGKDRINALTKAGYNYYAVQNKVNEQLGCAFRYSEDLTGAQQDLTKSQEENAEIQTEIIETLLKKSDAELEALEKQGIYTKDQINALKELKKYSDMTGLSVKEFIENIDEIDGRWLLINSFKNAGQGLIAVFNALKEAWIEIFPPATSDQLFSIIAGLHKFSTYLKVGDKTANRLKRTLKGVFAAIDIIATVISGPIKISIKLFMELLKQLGFIPNSVLDVTAAVGDAIVSFRNWFKEHNLINKAIEQFASFILVSIENTKSWINNNEELQKNLEAIRSMFTKIIQKIRDIVTNSENWHKAFKKIGEIIVTLCKNIKNWIKNNETLSNGYNGLKTLVETVSDKIKDWIKNNETLSKGFTVIQTVIESVTGKVKTWIDSNETLTRSFDRIKSALETVSGKISEWYKKLEDVDNVPKYIIEGLVKGLKNGVKFVIESAVELAKSLFESVCDFLEIDSPSKKFMAIGGFIISGLVLGIVKNIPSVKDALSSIVGSFDHINWTNIANSLAVFASLMPNKMLSATIAVVRLMGSVGVESMEGLYNGLKSGFGVVVDVLKELGKSMIEAISKVLTIKSPSKEFYDIGNNVILGLINGLKNGASFVGETIKNIGLTCVKIFKSIDFGKIFAAGLSVGMLFIGKSMLKTIDNISSAVSAIASVGKNLTAPLSGIEKLLSGIGSSVKDFAKGYKAAKQGEALKDMAIAIAILAASLFLLSKLDVHQLHATIGALAVLVIIIGALAFAMSKMGDLKSSAGSLLSGGAIASIGMALLLVASTMKILGSIETEKMPNVIHGLLGAVAALVILFAAIGKCTKGVDLKNIHKIGKMIKKIAVALLLLVAVIKLASMLKVDELHRGIAVVTALSILVGGLIVVSKLAGEHAKKAGSMLTKVAFALLIMVAVIKIASMLDDQALIRGLTIIGSLGLLFTALVAVSHFAGKNATKAGAMMLMMALAFAITVGVIKIAASMDENEVKNGIAVITALGVLFTALVGVSHFAGQNAMKAGSMLLMVSVALLIITGVLFILSKLDIGAMYKSLGIIAVLELLFAGLIYVTKDAKDCKSTIIAITVMLALLVAAVIGLSFIDSEKLRNSTAAISAIMIALGILISSTKKVGNVKELSLSLLPLLGAIALLGVILGLMSKWDLNPSIETAGALSILLLAMSGCLYVLTQTKNYGSKIDKAIIAMYKLSGVVAILAGVLSIMSVLNAEASIQSVTALSILLLAMTGVLGILNNIGKFNKNTTKAVTALYSLSGVVAILAVILGAMSALNIEASIPSAVALGVLLNAMAVACLICSKIPSPALATKGAIGLTAFLGVMAALILAAGGLFKILELLNSTSLIQDGGQLLCDIALILGTFVGNLIGGLLGGVTSMLPILATNLTKFMENIQGFINGVKSIDGSVLKGIGILAGAILLLTAASFLNSISSILTFGMSSFVLLGAQLSLFMDAASGFIEKSKNIDPSIMQGVKTLAEAILILTGSQILEAFTGDKSISDFADDLGDLGTGLKDFMTNLGTFDKGKLDTVKIACEAVKCLAEAAKAMPGQNGSWQKMFGEQSLTTFASQFGPLATGISTFMTNLGDFDKGKLNTVKIASEAVKSLAEAADAMPGQEGSWQKMFGEHSLATFGEQLGPLASGITQFMTNLGEFGSGQLDTVKVACEAVKLLAAAANSIPDTGVWQKIFGEKSLATFADSLPKLGEKLKEFMNHVSGLNKDQVNSVLAATEGVRAIAKLGEIDMKDTGKNLKGFGSNMVKFAKKVKEFISTIAESNSESITSAIIKTKDLINMAKSTADIDVESLKTFGDSLKTFAKKGVEDFIKEFSDNDPKERTKTAVSELVDSGIQGAKDKNDDVTDIFKKIGSDAINAVANPTMYGSASDAGKYLVQGFAQGISDNTYLATNASSSLGKAALQAAKEAIDAHSPSREAIKIGDFFGQGLVIGINDYASKTYDAGYNVGEYAKNGLTKAIARISDFVSNGIDSQPTIRPVLDLSEVESGVGAIGSMFNGGPSIGVMSNLRAISSGMNMRNQNGTNNDVVSAIDKLSKSLGNTGGDTYNINGVTYDDGSNITDAVKTLIRAAKVERRT